jgi:hypothetical protein
MASEQFLEVMRIRNYRAFFGRIESVFMTRGPGTGSWGSYGTGRGSQITKNLINEKTSYFLHKK